jgi:hypothetical protein
VKYFIATVLMLSVINTTSGYAQSIGDTGNSSPISSADTVSKSKTNVIPEPPMAEASEPQRIVRYFCRAWKDENFKAMYGAMKDSYRKQVSLKQFEALFQGDIERNGGLKDENIDVKEGAEGAAIRLKVQLVYRSISAKPKTVVAEVVKTPRGYRIVDSGILPLDLNNL